MTFLLLAVAALAAVLVLKPRRMTAELKPIPVRVDDKRPRIRNPR